MKRWKCYSGMRDVRMPSGRAKSLSDVVSAESRQLARQAFLEAHPHQAGRAISVAPLSD